MPPNAQILTELPHRRLEAWKWTDVSRSAKSQTGLSRAADVSWDVPDGVKYSRGAGHASDTIMGGMAKSVGGDSHNFYVAANMDVADILTLTAMTAGHARVAIMIDKGASLTLVEDYLGAGGAFYNLDIHIHLAEGARLVRRVVHDDPDDSLRICTTIVAAEKDAQVEQYALSFGGALVRLETRLIAEGENVVATLNGAYLLSGARHTDMTSYVQLKSPNCIIRQSVKGVVDDHAKSVFQGKFHVERAAQHTDAEMRHDALMLSNTAQVRAKPELEIYADDVACAHGNTLGALDEQALFYMRQRGIPRGQARAMLMQAFVVDVFDDLSDEDARAALIAKIQTWLEDSTCV